MTSLPSVPEPIGKIIITLAHNNTPMRHEEIGNTTGLSGSEASTYIDRAKKRGLIERVEWGVYQLTAEGEAMGRALAAYGHEYQPRMYGQKAAYLHPGDTPSKCAARLDAAWEEMDGWTSTLSGVRLLGGRMRSAA